MGKEEVERARLRARSMPQVCGSCLLMRFWKKVKGKKSLIYLANRFLEYLLIIRGLNNTRFLKPKR